MEKCWNPKVELMSREELRELQSERLRKTVERVYTNVPYYRARMQERGLLPGDIKSVDDLVKLPFMYKRDLRDTYPFGLFASPMDEIVRIHASSGTTGKQTVVGYTRADLDVWAECMARCLAMMGGGRHSIVHVAYGYGLFTGGLGAHDGAQRIGAAVIPASSGNTPRQVQIITDFKPTIICCTPSYALYIAETMQAMGVTKDDIALEAGCFGAEPWSEAMRREIELKLGLKAYDIYGLSEVMGPSVSHECECQNGLHVWEDHFIPEIIDSDTGEPLPPKTRGELVFTTITKEGLPLIRYRTYDICELNYGKCDCGRWHARMGKPAGRTDDMLIIRGVNVFPSQIEGVLLNMGGTSPHYQIIVDRVGNLDTMRVEIELSDELFSDDIKGLERLEGTITRQLESVLGLSCGVKLVESKSIGRSEGKAKRVIDNRKF